MSLFYLMYIYSADMFLISVLLIAHFVFSVCYDRNIQSEILLPFIMIINQAFKKNQYKKNNCPLPPMLNACKQILKRLKWFYYRGIISYHLVVYILEVWVVYLYLRRGELSFISIFL